MEVGARFVLSPAERLYLDMKYGGTKISSEFFNTAGRTVKTGLTAAGGQNHDCFA